MDIFRIYAPEAPFTDAETVNVFECFVAQLKGLANVGADSDVGEKILYILSSLSTVKSCVIPVILSQSGLQEAGDVVVSMLETLLSTVRADHSEEILEHVCSILQSCVEECINIDSEILDLFLTSLLPASKADNPTAFKCVESVLRHISAHIEPSLTKYINQIIAGGSLQAADGDCTELAEHAYPLVYELHKIAPEMLRNILPNISTQLDVDDVDVRSKVVKLLGRLYSSKHASYGLTFPKEFHAYLNRVRDLSPAVRIELIESGTLIMARHPQLARAVEESLRRLIIDPDHKVRLAALNGLMEYALERDVTFLSADTVRDLIGRAKDRRPEIVLAAISGMGRLYSKNVSSLLPPVDEVIRQHLTGGSEDTEDSAHNSPRREKRKTRDTRSPSKQQSSHPAFRISSLVPEEVLIRCSDIPSVIVSSWGYPDTVTRHLALTVLQEHILPRTLTGTHAFASSPESSQESLPVVTAGAKKPITVKKSGKDGNALVDQVRATALLLLNEISDDLTRKNLGSILDSKRKTRAETEKLITAVQSVQAKNATKSKNPLVSSPESNQNDLSSLRSGDDDDDDDDELDRALTGSIHRLLQLVPVTDKKAPPLERLVQMRDKHILRLFARSTQELDDSITDSIRHRDDMAQRLDSKSALSQYCSFLYDFSGALFVNRGVAAGALKYMAALARHSGSVEEGADVGFELLLPIAKHMALVRETLAHAYYLKHP